MSLKDISQTLGFCSLAGTLIQSYRGSFVKSLSIWTSFCEQLMATEMQQ